MQTERIEEIESLAGYIAESYFGRNKINPLEIASRNNITFSFGDYQEYFDGLLEYMNKRFHIYININNVNNQDHPRSRFTVAHELGHYFIEEHHNALVAGALPHPSFTEFNSDNVIEKEADLFAASLLMPKNKFISSCKKAPMGAKGIVELSKIFSTSLMSTAIRYVENSTYPVIVIFWSNNERLWQKGSNSFDDINCGWTYKDSESIPQGTLTSMALKDKLSFESALAQEKGSVLSAWFPSMKFSSSSTDILIEQVIPVGRYGVLTVLRLDN